jgi:predicted aspartyl protease
MYLAMIVFAIAAALALVAPQPATPAPATPAPATPAPATPAPATPAIATPVIVPTIPLATIDDSLEVTGEALEAQTLRSRMFIDVKVNGAGPFRFLVDSGADRSVIGAALAERLKLPLDKTVMLRGMAGSSEVQTVLIDSLDIGSSRLHTLVAPALPERFIGAQGIIGIDALSDQRLLLDFDARRVTIQDSRQPVVRLEGEIVVTARRRKGQLILTQASVDGSRTFAVIDTGSELTIGNAAMLRRIGRKKSEPLREISLQSVTGQEFTAMVAVLPELRIGGIVLRNVTVAFTDAPPFDLFGLDKQPALLLGTDLLKNFSRLSLDFRNRKVRFTLRRGTGRRSSSDFTQQARTTRLPQ